MNPADRDYRIKKVRAERAVREAQEQVDLAGVIDSAVKRMGVEVAPDGAMSMSDYMEVMHDEEVRRSIKRVGAIATHRLEQQGG